MSEKTKGHGHVTPNADGFLARCGGPSICKVCKAELAALEDRSRLVTTDWLKRIHRDLDACQKLIWANLRGCDPSYYEDAQERLREIDAMLAAAPVVSAEQQGVADGWIPVSERLPIVAAGKAIEVIVAVKRKHNGQVYVFTTEYLNCVQVNQDGQFVQDDDNDNAAITGWFYLSDDEETWHRTLGDGDELLAWQYKPAYAAAPAPSTTEGQGDE